MEQAHRSIVSIAIFERQAVNKAQAADLVQARRPETCRAQWDAEHRPADVAIAIETCARRPVERQSPGGCQFTRSRPGLLQCRVHLLRNLLAAMEREGGLEMMGAWLTETLR